MGAYPQIVDWNEDGNKDLLVGDASGFITIYRNIGTNDNPQLTNEGYIQVGSNDYNQGEKATPVVNDWNEDGKKDLLAGVEDGRVALLINQGTNDNPIFTAVQYVKANGVYLDLSPAPDDRSAPEIADLDGDGLKDLIIGGADGTVHFFSNSGTNANPVFSTSVNLQANNTAIDVGNYSRLEIVDWDEDNDLDLLAGNEEGYINLFLSTLNPSAVSSNELLNKPSTFILSQNYPNPFNLQTTIQFALPKSGNLRLTIYNALGQFQTILFDKYCEAGWHEIRWDTHHVTSGIYFVQLEADREIRKIKMCVIK